MARALAGSFVSFGLVNGLGVELSSGIRPALESTDGWFGVAAIAAANGRIAVGWVSRNVLGQSDPTGGFAVYKCE